MELLSLEDWQRSQCEEDATFLAAQTRKERHKSLGLALESLDEGAIGKRRRNSLKSEMSSPRIASEVTSLANY